MSLPTPEAVPLRGGGVAWRYTVPDARGGVVLVDSASGGGGAEPPRNAPPAWGLATIVGAGFSVVVVGIVGEVVEGVGTVAGAGTAAGDADGPSDAVAIATIAAARDLLPAGEPRFVVGVGAGGLYARLAGCAILGLDGVVAFGGRVRYSGVSARRPIQPLDLLPGLGCALQCHFRDDDPETPAAHVDELERRLAGVSRGWQVFRYPAASAVVPGARSVAAAGPAVGRSTTEAAPWQGADAATAWGRARAFLLHLAAERT